MPFILASASPRRAELLAAAGFSFRILPADVDETPATGEDPVAYVRRIAHAKADHVFTTHRPPEAILAADTTVVGGGRLMGKPESDDEARAMLEALSGVVHEVHTAVVLRQGAAALTEVVTTRVRFERLTAAEIAWYVGTGESRGKAGAYGIQGRAARFIDWIDGSWSNVVGLPISTVYRLLARAGELD